MPTKRQIEQLKEINDPLLKKKYAKFLQLPQDLQDAIFSAQVADTVWQIAQDNQLTSEQLWQFSYLVGMILLGEMHITEFIKSTQDKCKLSYEDSRNLARQANQEIFLPLKESLKIVHKLPKWPREEGIKPVQPQPTPVKPQPAYPSAQNRMREEEEKRTVNLR